MGSLARNVPDPLGILLDPVTVNLIDSVGRELAPNSKVLFVGCNYSLPIIFEVSSKNHEVHGIDGSKAHIDSAASLAGGHFKLVNEADYLPVNKYQAIFALFSLFKLSRAETHSLIYKISDSLAPNGAFVLGTSLSDRAAIDHCRESFEGWIREYPLRLNGKEQSSTICSRQGWVTLCATAGLTFCSESTHSGQGDIQDVAERHDLMIFRKTEEYAMMGPYPLPASYRGPIPLSEAAWKPFAERLVRDEFDFVLEVLKNNRQILDVGSGYGRLPIEIAARTGKAYSIEPNADRNSIQAVKAQESGVEIATGSAENIPYGDGFFDAVVAMWVMHYVDDLDKSLRELVRVANPEAPNARIVIVQGAPDNEVIDLMNVVCAPISASNKRPNHQGFLLHKAVQVFTELGFSDISFHRVDAYCEFLEADLAVRCEKAAEVVAGLWCLEDENFQAMKAALITRIKFNFQDRPHAIGDQVAILVAKPPARNRNSCTSCNAT